MTSLARKATLVSTAIIFSSLASTRDHPFRNVCPATNSTPSSFVLQASFQNIRSEMSRGRK